MAKKTKPKPKPRPKPKPAPKPAPPPEPKRGAARMRELGNVLVNVWLDLAEGVFIRQACRITGLPMATFIREQAVRAAQATIQAHDAEMTVERENPEN